MGISTFSAGYIFHKSATNFYTKSMIVAHDADSTTNIFNMVKRYYDFLPEEIKPMKRYSNRRELVFENPDENARRDDSGLLSSIEVETANNINAGRSGTIHHLHISELAFWSHAQLPLSGLFQAVPSNPQTSIIIESTANGITGDGKVFYDMWQAASQGLNDFTPFFIPWFENEDYIKKDIVSFVPTEKERDLKRQFDLSNEQLAWRRYKINNDLGGDETLFRQEFPASPDEAFILSGRPVFDLAKLQKAIHNASNSYVENGFTRIYSPPEEGQIYCIGADTAEGLETGDYSAAMVLDKNFNQCARIYGHLDPDNFGRALVDMACLYNKALVAPEINSMGYAVLSKIKDLNYSNIYQREELDTHEEKFQKKLGWNTNIRTKHLMLSEFITAFNDESLKINDTELLKEMMTLSYEPDGNVNLNGKDLVVSACISLQALKQTPNSINYKAFNPELHKEEKPPETFQQRMKRLNKDVDSYYD